MLPFCHQCCAACPAEALPDPVDARLRAPLACLPLSARLQVCPAQAITIETEEREDGSRRTTR
jgi:formate hydrogenlyase subunit 6/NADH:ubiquinone oxidoreductase subunit I